MEPKQGVHQENFLAEVLKFSLLALLIVLPIRVFVAQPYIVKGSSMHPTFEDGQYLIVDQLSYKFDQPARGDVVIFRYPEDPSKFFIKRIIALPRETIEIKGETVIIKNGGHPEGMILREPYVDENLSWADSIVKTLGINQYFVMGDNRSASSDSRVWGPLPDENIVGRAVVRLFPVSDADVFPGVYREPETDASS